MRMRCLVLLLVLAITGCRDHPVDALVVEEAAPIYAPLVPWPMDVRLGQEGFLIQPGTPIWVQSEQPGIQETALRLAEVLQDRTGQVSTVSPARPHMTLTGSILITDWHPDRQLGGEGYELKVTDRVVLLRASTPAGIRNGTQTLRQLIAAAETQPEGVSGIPLLIQGLFIKDRPVEEERIVQVTRPMDPDTPARLAVVAADLKCTGMRMTPESLARIPEALRARLLRDGFSLGPVEGAGEPGEAVSAGETLESLAREAEAAWSGPNETGRPGQDGRFKDWLLHRQ